MAKKPPQIKREWLTDAEWANLTENLFPLMARIGRAGKERKANDDAERDRQQKP